MKFGGRWLYQDQGFAYSGNEGILGHFNYSGTFTGFALRRLPSRPGVAEGARRPGGTVHASRPSRRHLRAGRLPRARQPHAEPRPHVGIHVALGREGRPPVEHRSHDRAVAARRPERQQPGALRRRTTAAGSRASASPGRRPTDWVVRGAFGIVQYMEGTGKNLQAPANPPFNFEGQRIVRPDDGRGQRGGWLRRHRPERQRRPGNPVSDLRSRPAAAAHEAVERLRRAQADRHAVGSDRLRGQPLGATWWSRSTSTSPSRIPVRCRPGGRSISGARCIR